MFLRTFYTREKFTRLSSIGLKKDRLRVPNRLDRLLSLFCTQANSQNFQRYNQTHFFNRSGIIDYETLGWKYDVSFCETVISNTEGKLRNNCDPSNCFCRKVKKPSWNPVLVMFVIGLTSSLNLLFFIIVYVHLKRRRINR